MSSSPSGCDFIASLLKQLVTPPTAQKSLKRMLRLEDVDWSRVYLLPRATTIETSLRSFQFKTPNERLFKLNAVESPQCSSCEQFPESVLHLFCTCSVTRSLWVEILLWTSNSNILLTSDLDSQYCILSMYKEIYRIKLLLITRSYYLRLHLPQKGRQNCSKSYACINIDQSET